MNGWIGVDFDGTLVTHEFPLTGKPIWPMIDRVKQWIADGQEVQIFTARICYMDGDDFRDRGKQTEIIENWCLEHFGRKLTVTCTKDRNCIAIYDDRAVQVQKDTGRVIETCSRCEWTHTIAGHDKIGPW